MLQAGSMCLFFQLKFNRALSITQPSLNLLSKFSVFKPTEMCKKKKNLVQITYSYFLIPISLHPDGVNL